MNSAGRRIYLHFLDHYHYGRAVYGGRATEETLVLEARRAFRLAALHADRLYLPASSYFEGKLAQIVLGDHSELSQLGVVYLAASQQSLEEHREGKLPQYPGGVLGAVAGAYTAQPGIEPPPYRQRAGSSRARITERWMDELATERPQRLAHTAKDMEAAKRIEAAWGRIPDLLESRAFVTAHVADLLAKRKAEVPEGILSSTIEAAYIDGYANSLRASVVGELAYLESPFPLAADKAFSFRRMATAFSELELLDLLDRANAWELLRFRDSTEWSMLRSILDAGGALTETHLDIAAKAKKVAAGPHRHSSMGDLEAQIGVVTALPEEFAAVRRMLDEPCVERKTPGDPNNYVIGSIPAVRDGQVIGRHRVALTQLRKFGTNSASSAATNLLRSYPSVRLVLMVGIACGTPNPCDPAKHVRLGDIVVSDRAGVVDFDAGVKTPDDITHRNSLPPASPALIGAANLLDANAIEGQRPWNFLIEASEDVDAFARPDENTDLLLDADGNPIPHPDDPQRRDDEPRVFRSAIGSSDLLIRDPDFRDEVAKKHALKAIEMEGTGIASAGWDHSCPYGVVRGVSDYGDGEKNDIWHGYAALVAAAYARCLLERVAPEDVRSMPAASG